MKLSTQIILAFAIVLITSILDSVANYMLSAKVKRNIEFLSDSETIIRNSNRLNNVVIEMQGAFRGYLLTDDTGFLQTYSKGRQALTPLINEEYILVKGSPKQTLLLDSIYLLHKAWLVYSDSLIQAKKGLSFSVDAKQRYEYMFENKLKKQIGKKLNDEISAKFQAFDRNEYARRNERSQRLIASIDQTNLLSYFFLAFTIIVGISSALYIVLVITKRIKSMVKLAEDISQGEFTTVTDTRNDELTGLSRSLNIMSDKLSKNIRELQNRNAELSKFAYVVSHDLKAPVRGIHNVIQWIKEDLGSEISVEMKKYLDIIPERTRRMEDLINGLLDYARISTKTKLEKVDTNLLVKEITETIVPRGFKVDIQKMPLLYTEKLKLEQVFTNLISNAIKYTPSANGYIIISCKQAKDSVEFSVKDNGIGIAPEYHEKIFEIFQTLREKHEKESTGVGLAIVKKVIDEHHGTIRVKSEEGNGAEFIFTWPNDKIA